VRVLFWGTSTFAVPSLRALIGEGFEVSAAVTQPDRADGRSRTALVPSPVKEAARDLDVPVLQPEQPRGDAVFDRAIRELTPDLSVVVSYGHILSREMIELPSLGTINVHASLLPRLRGAAPIQEAIREGLVETGVTIMRMVPALDAGPIILQARTPIIEDETAGELELRLSELGALALIEAVTLIGLGETREMPQDEASATYARKIDREMARVRWEDDAAAVARAIRAYDPKPGAWTTIRESALKLFGAVPVEPPPANGGASGEVLAVTEEGLLVACGIGAVRVSSVQPSGKKRLTPVEWQRGRGVAVGDILGAG
jgi:methionyl-tRNA formyltransferase